MNGMPTDDDHQATGIDARFEDELTRELPGWTALPRLPHVVHRPEQKRFVVEIDGRQGFIEYELADGVIRLLTTFVPPELRGHKIAAHLVAAALEYAERGHWKVAPVCSYVARFLTRHPEFRCLEIVQESNG